jgi:A/G-specific adenine glycosylase
VHGVGPVPVDGNVERVLIRLFAIDAPRAEAGRAARDRAQALAPTHRTGDVAQALMELGATVCRPRGPACSLCPWLAVCSARRLGLTDALPRPAERAERPLRRGVAFVLQRRDGAVLFRQRPPHGLLAGLHDLPSSDWVEGALDLDEAVRAAPMAADWRLVPGRVRHVFTHFALELTVLRAVTDTPPLGIWCRPDELGRLALPTVAVKVLRHAGLATAAVAETRRPARSG